MPNKKGSKHCAIYTRKSSDAGLEQGFNSLDAQREAAEAYIKSQRHEGWRVINTAYNDGGFSGGSLERPALKSLLADIRGGQIDVIVVYKVDRLTRSLADFAKLIELFEAHDVSFVSVTQQFNTTTSMGRLTLNVLLSFAQFEREVTGERIRDKIKASRAKGMWMGGFPPMGYDLRDRKLCIDPVEAERVRHIFERYSVLQSVRKLKVELDRQGWRSRKWTSAAGRTYGDRPFSRGQLYHILNARVYLGEAVHKGVPHPGEHEAIIAPDLWDRVQDTLAKNLATNASGTRHESPSLLKGLLFDSDGSRMSPSHATKKGKRYRYYVSQLENGKNVQRLPAHDLEQLVIDAVLEDVGSSLGSGLSGEEKTHSCRTLVRALIRRVTVLADQVVIEIESSSDDEITSILNRADDEPVDERVLHRTGDVKTIDFPFNLTKRGGIVRIETERPDGNYLETPHSPLMKAVVRAHAWRQKLEKDEAASIADLAKSQGLTDRYVSRILRLAYLAPDLVEAIVEGRLALRIPIEKLCLQLPYDWNQQRCLLMAA